MRIFINPEQPEASIIATAVRVLEHDGIIIYPTDTIYGLGCSVLSKKAIQKIYHLKRRERQKPFSFVCADLSMVAQYAVVAKTQYKILKKYLPGPYTFILEASTQAPKEIMPRKKRSTVGIRIPDHAVPLAIVKRLGLPIITTSVNLAGEESYGNPEVMAERFGKQVDIILDTGILPKEPSTIVDLTGDEPVIVRQGKGEFSYLA